MEKKIKTLLTILIAFTFAIGLSSCGNKAESSVKKQIELMNEYADTYEKNPKSASLESIEKKLADLEEKLSAAKLTEADKKKLINEYGTEMGKAAQRYAKAKMGSTMGNFGEMGGKMLEGFNMEGFGK